MISTSNESGIEVVEPERIVDSCVAVVALAFT